MQQIINAYLMMMNGDKHIQHQTETLRQKLEETTVPEHLQFVPERWNHHFKVSDETQVKISNAMTHGSFTHFPLNETRSDIDPDLAEHLTNHGYTIKDYGKGIVTKKLHAGDPNREKIVESDIVSALNKTKASPQIISDYAKSKKNSGENKAGLHVVISTSPMAIAGMSTGTHWKNTSCMNMEGGAYHHKLEDDSENGTHVAFLVPHDDPTAFTTGEPSNPLARIALKPYHEDPHLTHDSDTVFRPENRTYGDNNSSFTSAVARWATENYPAKADTTYHKNEAVYDDTNERQFTSISPESAKRAIDAGDHAKIVPRHGMSIDHHVIESALDYGLKKFDPNKDDSFATKSEKLNGAHSFVKKMSQIGNLNVQHVSRLNRFIASHENEKNSMSDGIQSGLYDLAASHGEKFSTRAIRNFHDGFATNLQKSTGTIDPVVHIPNRMLMSPKLPDEYVDKLDPEKYPLVNNQKIKPHHVDKLVDSYMSNDSGSSYTLRDMKHHLNSNHLLKLASNPKSSIHTSNLILSHPEFNQEHHSLLVKNALASGRNSQGLENILSGSKYATLDDALKSSRLDSLHQLAHNESIPEEEAKRVKSEIISRAASIPDSDGVQYVSKIPGMGIYGLKSHITKHFTDEDYDTLANKNLDMNFYDKNHSNKYLDKLQSHINHLDDALGDAHETEDEDEIDHHDTKLKGRIEAFAGNIENHIKFHVMDDNDEYVKDESEAEKTLSRIEHIRDNLTNYTGSSNRYDENEHYDDTLADTYDKLNQAVDYTQNRDLHDHW